LADFFLGDSRVFLGDIGDLAFLGDSLFFGDFVDLALAALAFLGDVASFLGLDAVVGFLAVVEVVEVFFATGFLVEAFLEGDFLGDLVGVVDDFFELDVDLFFGEEGTVVEDPDVTCVDVVVEVDDFLAEDFFFLATLPLDPGASLYEAFTFTNNTPSFRLRESLTCLRAVSKSIL